MKPTILLVESKEGRADLRKLPADFAEHFLVERVNGLTSAMAVIKNGGIAAVLLNMPSDDQPISRIHAITRKVPIVALLSKEEAEMSKEVLEAGADDVLVKDETLSLLLTKGVLYAIERKRAKLLAERTAPELFALSPFAVIRLNNRMIVQEANPAFHRVFQVTKTYAGISLFKLFPSLSKEEADESLKRGVAWVSEDQYLECSLSEPDKPILASIACWPLGQVKSDTSGYIMVINDLSETSPLAKRRDSIVTVLTHDLKNPLIGAGRIYELLLKGQFGNLLKQQSAIVSALRKTNEKSLEIIDNLLSLLSFEKRSPVMLFKQIDLQPVVAKCVQDLKHTAGLNELKLVNEIRAGSLANVCADSLAMQHLLNNLISNALKFTPAGGTVRVSGSTAGDIVRITITDDGPGIPTAEQAALFHAFEQGTLGRKTRGGTGLGLYLCRQIMEAHNGGIYCTSAEGSGSAFTIEIPVASAASAPPVSYPVPYDFRPKE